MESSEQKEANMPCFKALPRQFSREIEENYELHQTE
jgi:hypothetical protein